MKGFQVVYLIISLLFVTCNYSQAQSGCKHLDIDSNIIHDIPFFGDNQFLYNLLDSIHSAHNYTPNNDLSRIAGTGLSNNFYHIPVTFVIHYDGDTNTNVPKYVAEHMLNETNQTKRSEDLLLCQADYTCRF
ncbi:MAG TPA: hypothetical protein VLZ75_09060 [Chitinophagales bacterium]|nr:hypothetical protein [Chitinophagales bacterium]